MLAVLTISRKHHQIATGFEAANQSRFMRHSRLSQNPHATAIILTHGAAGTKLFRERNGAGGGSSNGPMIGRAPGDIARHAVSGSRRIRSTLLLRGPAKKIGVHDPALSASRLRANRC